MTDADAALGTPGGTADQPALFFSGPAEFRAWLEANHDTAQELWVGLYKKHVAHRGLTWEQAVPEALCFGWIDSVAHRVDADTTRQRWTPRRATSVWSAVNIALVEELTAQHRMHPAGLAAFAKRTPERSGIYAYEKPSTEHFPPEFDALLRANPVAAQWFDAAILSYRKLVVHWVTGAKQEATRRKRLAEFIEDSCHGRLIKTQRYGAEPAWARRNREALGIGAGEGIGDGGAPDDGVSGT